MLKKIRGECQCMKGKGRNSNFLKDKVRISMFQRIKWEFQCLKGWGRNFNV